MTFSLVARCPESGMMGITISSSSICVAARCVYARAGVGAVATQNVTDPRLGTLGLDLLERGFSAPQVIDQLTRERPWIEHRQLTVVDDDGHVACFSGGHTLGRHATATGTACAAAGNLLADEGVAGAMVSAYEAAGTDGHLAERLVRALKAGLDAGGEEDTVHSAAVYVVERRQWPVVDLRVDWHDEDPIGELQRLWKRYESEVTPYLTRALNPSEAPSYGVKGDL